MTNSPIPVEIKLLQKSRSLRVDFNDGEHREFTCDFLRKHSPSADKTPPTESVNIIEIEPVGQYAVRLVFDDGHETGIYSWEYLYKLGTEPRG